MNAFPRLDVCLNGARDYVQGTQMIALSAAAIASNHLTTPVELQAATFHRITNTLVELRPGAADAVTPNDRLVGALSFLCNGTKRDYCLIEGSDTAPRRNIAPAASWSERDVLRESRLSAEFDLTGLECGEDLLVAIVQTVKGLHEALADDVHDVWLTGFRAANVPMVGQVPSPEGVLTLQSRRSMKGDGVWQTLQLASFSAAGAEAQIRAAVTFSLNSKELTHVD